jgi:hypothetical protein
VSAFLGSRPRSPGGALRIPKALTQVAPLSTDNSDLQFNVLNRFQAQTCGSEEPRQSGLPVGQRAASQHSGERKIPDRRCATQSCGRFRIMTISSFGVAYVWFRASQLQLSNQYSNVAGRLHSDIEELPKFIIGDPARIPECLVTSIDEGS